MAVSPSSSTVSEEAQHLISPAVETASLCALKDELSNLPHDEKSALVHVQRVAPNLVDDDHLLVFLRGEDFDVNLALTRLLRHWSQRYKIFGPEKYALPMTLYGAMKDHIQALKQGYLTLLPMCDEAGRQIIYLNKNLKSNPSTDEKLQLMWYILHVAMQNPVVKKSGYVVLVNARGGRLEGFDTRWASQAASFMERAFPIRWKMVHVCHVNAVFPLVAQAVKAILSQMQRKSLLLHNGSDERVLESLSEYGLPKHCVPTYLGGTFHVSTDAFVRDRLTIEGGALESNANIAKGLSSSHDDDSGSNPKTTDEVLGDLIYDSSHTAKTREVAKSRRLATMTVTSSQGHPLLTNNQIDTVIAIEYASAKSSIPTNNADAFLRDRLTIEGGALESNANIAKSLSSNHDDDGGSNPKTADEVLGDLIYKSSHTAKTREDAKSSKLATMTVTSSQGHPPLTNDQIDAVIAVEYAPAKSSIPTNSTTAPPIPEKDLKNHSLPKTSQLKRKNNNGPPVNNESKKYRATPVAKAEKGQVKHGRSGDPRMNRAVQAKVDNPNLSLVAALMAGGFIFNTLNAPGLNISAVKDAENVTIYQRRNQLLRRLRRIKGKASKT